MEIKDFAYGNAVKGNDDRVFKLDTTILGLFSQWKNTNNSKNPPFFGISLDVITLKKLGFDEYILSDVDLMKFTNVFLYRVSKSGVDKEPVDYPIILAQDLEGYKFCDIRFTDEGQWLEAITKPLNFVHELQNSGYWSYNLDIIYESNPKG